MPTLDLLSNFSNDLHEVMNSGLPVLTAEKEAIRLFDEAASEVQRLKRPHYDLTHSLNRALPDQTTDTTEFAHTKSSTEPSPTNNVERHSTNKGKFSEKDKLGDHRTVKMLLHATTARPACGFIVAAQATAGEAILGLRVFIEHFERPHESGQSVRASRMVLTTGLLHPSQLISFTDEVTVKQTTHQNWLETVWRTVMKSLSRIQIQSESDEPFKEIEVLDDNEIAPKLRVKLSSMLWANYWQNTRCPVEAKRSEIAELGLPVSATAAAFDKVFKDMKIIHTKVEQNTV